MANYANILNVICLYSHSLRGSTVLPAIPWLHHHSSRAVRPSFELRSTLMYLQLQSRLRAGICDRYHALQNFIRWQLSWFHFPFGQCHVSWISLVIQPTAKNARYKWNNICFIVCIKQNLKHTKTLTQVK